jgi:hypothetical protein
MTQKRPRVVNADAGRVKIIDEMRCRACKRFGLVQRHHLVPRSLLGDDVDDNIIPLCLECHDRFENSRFRLLVGEAIRPTLTSEEIAYILGRKSVAFLDAYYPLAWKRPP